MTYLPQARRFDWSNFGVRLVSTVVLIPAVLLAVWTGSWLFLLLLSVAVALLAIEWASMSAPRAPMRVSAAVTAAVLGGVFLAYTGEHQLAWGVASLGALAAALIARGVAERPFDAAYGVIYIGIPCLCLVWLRATPQGEWWTMMLLAITWSADIAAFAVGSALKGPKLWVRFSPNKTWSGFIGGLLAGALVGALMASLPLFRLNLAAAAAIGLAGGLATMAGDLWESMLKRRFGVKDSGDLIPGHGGLMDRVDGLMFAVAVISAARLVNHLGWGH
ncbi:phosphatidate cytidylyltransferase [Phenylobacterium sp.]|uniref:phosphatidate cytidylyltransferase n=1 Tax=Phenylobacterium sp. TaxID=1871053 RepID=UPI0027324F6C|nr:phosphatidate cytidylyltransferase [Phenylobacterium sp.]MDP3660590.1 phosphatidate cytidylyltransferase [Phenylobacterium sp.]